MHGGLFSEDDVCLDDIRNVDRKRQPPEEGDKNLLINNFILFVCMNEPSWRKGINPDIVKMFSI